MYECVQVLSATKACYRPLQFKFINFNTYLNYLKEYNSVRLVFIEANVFLNFPKFDCSNQ